MRREVADCGCSSAQDAGLPPSRGGSVTRVGLGLAELRAQVGGLIRQGRPLPMVLAGLCQFFDATAKGLSSRILLVDHVAGMAGHANGPGLPDRHMKQLAAEAAAPGLRLYEVAPILTVTGEPLGIFALYRRECSAEVTRCHSALIPQLTHVAGAAIERMRSDEALKRSAALLERTQLLSSTCCFSWRVKTDEISWSNELCRLFAIEPQDAPVTLELIGTRIHAEDLASFHAMIERARNGTSDFEFEHRLRLPDSSVKHLRVVAHPTRDREGQLEYIGAVQDVTHRRQVEEALAKLRAELARAARITSLGVLTAAIAHEVNQPLAGIVTNANTCRRMLALDPPDIEGARETARRTIRDAERASEVIKRLRALFSKKGATSESVDLNEAAQEVVALSLSELERNKVMVRTELARELPRIQGDRVQLQQVILNLFLNAADAMSGIEGCPRQLLIKTERDGKEHVRLSVRDTGVGFEPQGVDRLFEAFYTTKSGGMGIGLSVSRSIVERHRGRLWVEPNDGPGATFAFSIPRNPDGQ